MERNIPGNIEFINVQAANLNLDCQAPHNTIVDPNEVRLIHRAKSGDNDALGEILESRRKNLFAIIFSRVLHHETAEDLTQVVLMKAVEHFPGYEPRGIPISHWLRRIASNVAKDHLRSKRKRNTVALEAVKDYIYVPGNLQPEHIVEMDFELERVKGLIETMTPAQQKIIKMRLLEGHDYEQIATEDSKTKGNLRVIEHRALKKLRSALIDEAEIEALDLGNESVA